MADLRAFDAVQADLVALATTLPPDKAVALMKLVMEVTDLHKARPNNMRTRERPRRTRTPPPTFKTGQRVKVNTETKYSQGAKGGTGKIMGPRGDVQWDIKLDTPLPDGQMVIFRKYSSFTLLPDIDV